MVDVASLQMERDRLRAALAEVRRLLLPHPDAGAGEDAGCGCDMQTATTAAAWAAAELKRCWAELAVARRLVASLSEKLAVCSESLGRAAERIPPTLPPSQVGWDRWFLGLARYYSTASKDPSTQVGCVITRGNKQISQGYNGFPAGCDDAPALYADRPTKLRRVLHADLNAVLFASQPLAGCTAYLWPMPPCPQCAAVFCQVGISRVVCPPLDAQRAERWADDMQESVRLFAEKGVELVYLSLSPAPGEKPNG